MGIHRGELWRATKKKGEKKSPVDRYNSHLHTSKGYLLCPKHVTIIKSAKWVLLLRLPLCLSVKGCCADRSDAVLSLADTETCPFCCAKVQEVGQARSRFRRFWVAIGQTAGAIESRAPAPSLSRFSGGFRQIEPATIFFFPQSCLYLN